MLKGCAIFFILISFFLPVLLLSGRRYRDGFLQRIGFYPRRIREAMRGARPIWIHAASVGEVLSSRYLAGQLKSRFPKRKILLSTFTSTGNEIARQAVPAADCVIFAPLDYPWIVKRALTVFDPSLLVFLETEIWLNLHYLAYRRGIPTILLSGRLSPVAFRRYSFFRFFFSRIVRLFTAAGMQTDGDAERLIRLGVDRRKVSITGSLKHTSLSEEKAVGQARSVMDWIPGKKGNRQVLVAGSTHRGEEEILLDVFLFLKSRFPNLFLVLAPRHPQRFGEVEGLLKEKEVRYEKRSQTNGRARATADVIFLDTLGDLPDFYSLADIAFVGGSLVDAGGHNLIEPARFRKPILFGPHMTNFADIAEEYE